MSDEEYRAFMVTGRAQRAATVRPGTAACQPVWFVLDRDDLPFTTHKLRDDAPPAPRSAYPLTIDDQEPPNSYAIIEGTVALSDNLEELMRWATVIGGRYMGGERAAEFGKRNGVPGELLVRVTPTKIFARADIAGY
jgi:hypothetical protein